MSRSAIATSAKPRFIVPGTAALDPGVERYVVRGGGSAVFALERDDLLEIALLEGGQAVEIVAFGKGGKSDLAAIGLKGKGKPEGLQNILASGSDDAERVRFGLFRRGLELGHATCAKLFGADAPAGEAVNLKAERAAVVVVSAPAAGMLVWDQTPPTDVLVFITRARVLAPGELRLPEPLTAPRLDFTINIASAESFEVAEGEYIQIVDIAGRQCSDFLAFNRRALDNNEVLGIDSTTTRTALGLAYPTPGLYSKFLDRNYNPLVEVLQDTVGRHDTFGLACTRRTYEDQGYFGHANCSDNFNRALHNYGVGSYIGWPAINFFYNTNVGADNVIWFDEPWSRPGDYVLMLAP